MKGITASNSIFIAILCFLVSASFVSQAFAGHGHHHSSSKKRLELYFNNWHLKGKNKIFLKRELKDHYPNLRLKNYSLRKVVLFAKSKHGHGKVKLRVGDYYSKNKVVDGYPRYFHEYDSHMDKVKFRNRYLDARGPWQLHLRGNFKVSRVIVVLVPNHYAHNRDKHGHHNSSHHNQGHHSHNNNHRNDHRNRNHHNNHNNKPAPRNVQKVVSYSSHHFNRSDKKLYVNRKINQIQFLGKKRKTDIQKVYVEFGNGEVRRLTELEGKLSSGENKNVTLNRYRYVKHISFEYKPRKIGKRTRFQVKV